jgi:hypothetical protein
MMISLKMLFPCKGRNYPLSEWVKFGLGMQHESNKKLFVFQGVPASYQYLG